jgi:hypothetical protein
MARQRAKERDLNGCSDKYCIKNQNKLMYMHLHTSDSHMLQSLFNAHANEKETQLVNKEIQFHAYKPKDIETKTTEK